MHNEPVEIFDKNAKEETPERQSMYTAEATKLMETELKTTLAGLAANLFGKGNTQSNPTQPINVGGK